MSLDVWVNEALNPGWGQRFRVTRELARCKSRFQDIAIFETAEYGRVMMLDGIVQITEADEFVYQEMLVHVPLIAHGNPERVLIIGAGDGGVLRHVLQHAQVRQAVMVEIDDDVIRLARRFLPAIGGDAWEDPRAQVIVDDGAAYMETAAENAFDAIIIDSTDPGGASEALFGEAFYRSAARVLTPSGVLVNQCGVPFVQSKELRLAARRLRAPFPAAGVYLAAVPTYIGGFMALGFAANNASFAPLAPAELRRRAAAAGILGKTRYWTPEVHAAAFALPPYIAELLTTPVAAAE